MDAGSDSDGGDGAADVEFVVLGGPDDGRTLRLDHERFAYAGKFVLSRTGKAVAMVSGAATGGRYRAGAGARGSDGDESEAADGDEDVVAAAAFDLDRTDPSVARVRYVTVRRDRRGAGLGARLLAFLADRLLSGAGGIDAVREVRIAVNNPFAYEAAYKAGFGYTGERTGLAELLCARPADRSVEAYRQGLTTFRARDDLDGTEREFLEERLKGGLPPTVEPTRED